MTPLLYILNRKFHWKQCPACYTPYEIIRSMRTYVPTASISSSLSTYLLQNSSFMIVAVHDSQTVEPPWAPSHFFAAWTYPGPIHKRQYLTFEVWRSRRTHSSTLQQLWKWRTNILSHAVTNGQQLLTVVPPQGCLTMALLEAPFLCQNSPSKAKIKFIFVDFLLYIMHLPWSDPSPQVSLERVVADVCFERDRVAPSTQESSSRTSRRL